MNIMINQNTLEVVKGLIRLALRREQEVRLYNAPKKNLSDIKFVSDLCLNPPKGLLKAIQYHRVETVLAGDSLIQQLFFDLDLPLKELARQEAMSALALASLTREISCLFENHRLPMMVLKGIPLSLQTTKTLTARGRGDLDLWVSPRQLGEAIHLLESEGFRLTAGPSCVGDVSLRGSYSRFVWVEITLKRVQGSQVQSIDLHWHPTHIRGVLPSFRATWEQREILVINGQKIATLPRNLAFAHSCCHANWDRWLSLRQLVDVIRLAKICSDHDILKASVCRPVSKTCCVAAELSGGSLFDSIAARVPFPRRRNAIRVAKQAQLSLSRNCEGVNWLFVRVRTALRIMNCHYHPAHLLSHALSTFVPPASLVDGQSGRHHSFVEIILYRWNLLRKYMNGSEE